MATNIENVHLFGLWKCLSVRVCMCACVCVNVSTSAKNCLIYSMHIFKRFQFYEAATATTSMLPTSRLRFIRRCIGMCESCCECWWLAHTHTHTHICIIGCMLRLRFVKIVMLLLLF